MHNHVSLFRRSFRRSDVFYSVMALVCFIIIFQFIGESSNSAGEREVNNEPSSLSIRQALAYKRLYDEEKRRKRMQKSLHEIGMDIKVSKVEFHNYDCLYEDALAPYRNVKGVKVLEIGLGCDIQGGPGASYRLWSDYFLDPDLTFMEYERPCAEEWYEQLRKNLTTEKMLATSHYKIPKMFYGDMKNTADLEQMAEEFGPWDVIIDDGFHEPSHQIPALKFLFKHVNPGGTYFVEDLYVWTWGNPDNRTILKVAELFTLQVAYNQGKLKRNDPSLFDDMVSEWGTLETGGRVDRITCCQAVCGIRVTRDK